MSALEKQTAEITSKLDSRLDAIECSVDRLEKQFKVFKTKLEAQKS